MLSSLKCLERYFLMLLACHPQSQVLILDLWQVASSGFFLPKIVPEERILWKTVTNYRHIWLNTAKYGQNLQLVNGPKSTLEIVDRRKGISYNFFHFYYYHFFPTPIFAALYFFRFECPTSNSNLEWSLSFNPPFEQQCSEVHKSNLLLFQFGREKNLVELSNLITYTWFDKLEKILWVKTKYM